MDEKQQDAIRRTEANRIYDKIANATRIACGVWPILIAVFAPGVFGNLLIGSTILFVSIFQLFWVPDAVAQAMTRRDKQQLPSLLTTVYEADLFVVKRSPFGQWQIYDRRRGQLGRSTAALRTKMGKSLLMIATRKELSDPFRASCRNILMELAELCVADPDHKTSAMIANSDAGWLTEFVIDTAVARRKVATGT